MTQQSPSFGESLRCMDPSKEYTWSTVSGQESPEAMPSSSMSMNETCIPPRSWLAADAYAPLTTPQCMVGIRVCIMGKITQHRTPVQLSQAAQEQRGIPLPTPVAPSASLHPALSLLGCPLPLLPPIHMLSDILLIPGGEGVDLDGKGNWPFQSGSTQPPDLPGFMT